MRAERERLEHILEAIERIEKYAPLGEETFRDDDMMQTYMIHYVQLIGEAARALPKNFHDQHPDVPWHDIIGMRHVLVHDYFDIDLDIVWKVISRDIPKLKNKIKVILEEMGKTP